MKTLPLVAIVGRTNVGKSTLFNALSRRRLAVVEDLPGVTRDRNYGRVAAPGMTYSLVDTGGLIGEEQHELADAVARQSRVALAEADLVLAVMDGLNGIHPYDQDVVQELRRSGKQIIWVINKCEKSVSETLAAEFYSLGIDEFVCISAAHRIGIDELQRRITAALQSVVAEQPQPEEQNQERPIRVAVIGRPNVGKSTLINKILGEERLIASPVPGTTRDSIDVRLRREGRDFILVDTAGLRKKGRIDDGTVERFSNLRTIRALAMADVTVLLLDATQGAPSEQDTRIAMLAHERGKGLIVAVNKWDLVEKDHRTSRGFIETIRRELRFARYAPVLFISALTGQRCPNVLQYAQRVYDDSRQRVQTSDLNRLLGAAMASWPPPVYRGEPVKLFFATQTGVAPPSFVLFMNHPQRINFSYKRFLQNAIRKEFPFTGVDLKLDLKKRTAHEDRRTAENE